MKNRKNAICPGWPKTLAGAYALSEAGSGSDAFALQTRAELKGTDYVINGRKLWITNAKEAGLFVLFATRRSFRRIQRHHRISNRKRFSRIHGGKKGRQAWHSRFLHLRTDS